MTSNYKVYVIQNPEGRFYTGLSENVAVRLGFVGYGIFFMQTEVWILHTFKRYWRA